MRKPFWLIDGRLREAAYFFDGMRSAQDLDQARHHFSAFLSAFVSVFDATDRTLQDVTGFIDWWDAREEALLSDPTIAYLWKIRNQIVHEGLNPLGTLTRNVVSGVQEVLLVGEWLPLSETNARLVCGRAMYLLAKACSDAYSLWWSSLDLPDELSVDEIYVSGRALELIELELGLPRGWSDGEGITTDMRLRSLKDYSQTVAKELLWYLQDYAPPAGAPLDDSLRRVIARRRKQRHER